MVQKGTYLTVLDNSGAKKLMCIHVYGGYRKRYANLGDVILASVKSVKKKKKMKIKKGQLVKALVVKTKVFTAFKAPTSLYMKYKRNFAIVLSKLNKPLGTKLFGLISRGFRYTRYSKLITLSAGKFLKQ